MGQLQSEFVWALSRGPCKDCQEVYPVYAPWEGRSRGLTQVFEVFALTRMREMPVSKAGEILGERDQKLWQALFAHVDAAWAALRWEDVVWVGADEMNRKKGHNYLTVFVDLVQEQSSLIAGLMPPFPPGVRLGQVQASRWRAASFGAWRGCARTPHPS